MIPEIPESFNHHERHITMVDEWMSKREKLFRCRVYATLYYPEDSDVLDEYEKEVFVNLTQRELDCVLRHGAEQRTSPTETEIFYNKFFEEPDGEEAKELLECIKERIKKDYSTDDVVVDDVDIVFIDAGTAAKHYLFYILPIDNICHPIDENSAPITVPHTWYPFLSDEDYRELMIELLDHRNLTFNRVARYHADIYARLYDQLYKYDDEDYPYLAKPFVLLFGELLDDAFQIAGPPLFMGKILDIGSEECSRKICLDLVDRKASFTSTVFPAFADGWGTIRFYYDIPIDAFMDALGVTSYDAALQVLVNSIHSEKDIETFLDEHELPYEEYYSDEYVPWDDDL